jgi:hypothetical protein
LRLWDWQTAVAWVEEAEWEYRACAGWGKGRWVVACSFPGDGDGEAVVTEAWFGSQCCAQLGRKMPSRFPFAKDIIAHPVRGRAITVGAIKIYLLAAAATNSVFILANELVVLQHDLELGLQGPAHIEQQFFFGIIQQQFRCCL